MSNQNRNTDSKPRDDKAGSKIEAPDRGQEAQNKDHDKASGQSDRNRKPQDKGRGSQSSNQSQGKNAPTR
jgi:hypothetical protein